MKNKWKTAFWVQFILFFLVTLVLLYAVIDQSVTLTYMQEGYQDTESDLQQISSSIKGRLNRDDFKDIIKQSPGYNGEDLELNTVKISFGANGKVDSVTTQ